MREAAGISAGELGRILGVSRQLPLQFEKAEADDSITLRSLRTMANALNCDLVYALVPRSGPTPDPAEIHAHQQKAVRKAQPLPARAAEEPEPEDHGTGDYFCD